MYIIDKLTIINKNNSDWNDLYMLLFILILKYFCWGDGIYCYTNANARVLNV